MTMKSKLIKDMFPGYLEEINVDTAEDLSLIHI